MNFIDILGYIAMILVASSFLLRDVIKLRLMNSCGALCFVIYGLLINSLPVTWLNIFVVCVNGYYVLKTRQQEKFNS